MTSIIQALRNKLTELRGHKPSGVDIGKLQRRCTMSEGSYIREALAAGATVVSLNPNTKSLRKNTGGDRYYIHYDNGGDVLAVAHLDTVLPQHRSKFASRIDPKTNQRYVISSELDDRLGAYIIMDMLPALGVTGYDILLTTDEESGMTTAEEFKAPNGRQYKWIFEFDRRGDDVVMYDYGNDDLIKIVEDEGFEVGEGSFTDICRLTHLKAAAINFGCGYENPHSEKCYARLSVIEKMVFNFVLFWEKYKDEVLPFDLVSRYARYKSTYSNYYGWDDDYDWGIAPSRLTTPVKQSNTQDLDYCDITNIEFPVEDLRFCEAPDAQWIVVHKHFFDVIRDDNGNFKMERFLMVADQWTALDMDQRGRYIAEFMEDPITEYYDDETDHPDHPDSVDEDILIARCGLCGETYSVYVTDDPELEGLCPQCAAKLNYYGR